MSVNQPSHKEVFRISGRKMQQYQSTTSLLEPRKICVQNKQVTSWDLLTMDPMGPKFYMDSRGDLEMTVLPCKLLPLPFRRSNPKDRREMKNRKRKFEKSSELKNSEFIFAINHQTLYHLFSQQLFCTLPPVTRTVD